MDTHALHTVKKYDRVLINRALEVRSPRRFIRARLMEIINDTGFIQLFI